MSDTQADAIKPDAKAIFLSKESLLISGPRLQVVDAFDVGNIGTHSGVRKPSVLGQCFLLQTRGEIGKWITAGIIVELVMPHERAYGQHCVGIQQMGPCGSNIESPDLRALVCRSDRKAVRTEAAIIDHKARPCARSLLVKRIRRLKP